MAETRVIEVDNFDHRILVKSVMELRNTAIRECIATDDLDDLLLRIIDAPEKKEKRKADREAR